MPRTNRSRDSGNEIIVTAHNCAAKRRGEKGDLIVKFETLQFSERIRDTWVGVGGWRFSKRSYANSDTVSFFLFLGIMSLSRVIIVVVFSHK